MTTYTVTAASYNSSAFWSAISESTSGHVLDLTGLPSSFVVSVQQDINEIWIADGSFVYKIGEAGSGANFTLGAPTDMDFFTEVRVGDSPAWLLGSSENETLLSGAGNDTIEGGDGADDINGGAGDDTLDGGAETIRSGATRATTLSLAAMATTGLSADRTLAIQSKAARVTITSPPATLSNMSMAGLAAIPSCPTFRVQGTSKTGI